jgi:hypothetical protein
MPQLVSNQNLLPKASWPTNSLQSLKKRRKNLKKKTSKKWKKKCTDYWNNQPHSKLKRTSTKP